MEKIIHEVKKTDPPYSKLVGKFASDSIKEKRNGEIFRALTK